jgi:predicted RNase H-like HicB family nuclease
VSLYILNKKHGTPTKDLIRERTLSFDRKKQRRHEFWILTCYVDLELICGYVKYLAKEIRITDVFLAFNFSEIYKNGPKSTEEKLISIQNDLNKIKINFEWKTLASSKLVHSKGYAIIQKSDGHISDGFTLTTSANFTHPGFYGENVELGYLSTQKKDIKDFERIYNHLWENLGRDLHSAVFKDEAYLFKFALLSSGVFLHKWQGSIKQHTGIKYELTSLAKEKGSIAPELATLGFDAGNTFTRQVLDMNDLPQKEVPGSFIKKFTIETYWGRWCPTDAWQALSEIFNGASEFIKKFEAATDDLTLERVMHEANLVQSDLIKKGLIERVGKDHIANWKNRIQELRSNHRCLERFFIGYESHELPYSIEQISDIEELFANLKEAIDLSKAKNTTKDKILIAIKKSDPSLIKLSSDDIYTITHEQ